MQPLRLGLVGIVSGMGSGMGYPPTGERSVEGLAPLPEKMNFSLEMACSGEF